MLQMLCQYFFKSLNIRSGTHTERNIAFHFYFSLANSSSSLLSCLLDWTRKLLLLR